MGHDISRRERANRKGAGRVNLTMEAVVVVHLAVEFRRLLPLALVRQRKQPSIAARHV